MEFIKHDICKTVFGNYVTLYKSKGIESDKWLYMIAGIHGDEFEGVYILNQLLEWMQNTLTNILPIIVIPILNIDGHQVGTRTNARKIDLNRNFPIAFKRQIISSQFIDPKHYIAQPNNTALSETETLHLKNYLDKFPPQLMISFHSTINRKMITLGETSKKVGEFLAKYNNYEVIDDNNPIPGTLESFIFDFYLSSVITIKVSKANKEKHYKDIWNENANGLFSLLNNQAY